MKEDNVKKRYLKVGTFQGKAIVKNPELALKRTIDVMEESDNNAIDIL